MCRRARRSARSRTRPALGLKLGVGVGVGVGLVRVAAEDLHDDLVLDRGDGSRRALVHWLPVPQLAWVGVRVWGWG